MSFGLFVISSRLPCLMNSLPIGRVLGLLLLIATPWSETRGDVFRYKDGRVIAGKVVDESKETVNKLSVRVWAVEVDMGVFVRVLESELQNNGFEPLADSRREYEKRVVAVEQSVAGHSAEISQCSKDGLLDLANAHYLRVLDMDPDNRPAREATGYDMDTNGRWVKKEVVMGEQRGKVKFKGRWRFPESIQIEQNKEELRQRVGAATRDLNRWHSTALTARGARYDEAIRNLQQIEDPLATSMMAEFLLDTRKPAPLELKLIYVSKLAKFKNVDSAHALARATMLDPNPQIRTLCMNALTQYGREVAIPIFMGYLSNDNNGLVNSAAEGLGQLRAENAVLPLIDALVTKHVQEQNSAGISASPTSGTFSTGQKPPIERDISNQSVLATLQQLTGQAALGFDEGRWIAWYASVHAPPAFDLRRDR